MLKLELEEYLFGKFDLNLKIKQNCLGKLVFFHWVGIEPETFGFRVEIAVTEPLRLADFLVYLVLMLYKTVQHLV
jgi:hypothetical protein